MQNCRTFVCLATVSMSSSLAAGAAFSLNGIDAGGSQGSLGNPITWSGVGSVPTAPGLLPPSSSDILLDPSLGRTSYFVMDPIGLSSPTYTSNQAIALLDGCSIGSGSARGIYFSSTFIPSGPGDRVVIMSLVLSTASAGTLTTSGILANIKDFGTASPNGSLGALRFGLANASTNGGLWGQSYYLDAVVIPADSGGFPGNTQYEISIVAVPAPSAAVLLGFVASCSLRRRSR